MTHERQQTAILRRMFFGRLFESDLMPPGLPQVQLVVWVTAFLGAPSIMAPLLLSKQYMLMSGAPLYRTMAAHRTIALVLSMIATGLITLVIWENVFPDRRDGRILGILPVRTRTFVVARLTALMMVFGLVVLAMTLCSALAWGLVNLAFGGPGGFFRMALSHLGSAAGLEAIVFFGIIAIQCALLNVLGAAAAQRLAVVMQFAMVVGLLQMPLLFPVISLPNVQWWAPLAGLAMCGITLTFYVASYRRMMRLALEGTGVSSAKRPTLQGVVPLAARVTTLSPAARGICAFTLRTVIRSRQHRMLLAGWLGLAFAIAASGIVTAFLDDGLSAFDRPRTGMLAVPLVFQALILVGMRMAFAIPSEIRANWTMKSRQPIPVRDALSGAAAALVAATIPSVLFAWISATALWGPTIGLIHTAFCATLGVLLAELLAIGLDKVPFTCTYVPGKARFVKLWPLYLTAFSFYTYTMAGLEAGLIQRGGIYLALAVLILLAGGVAYFRSRRAADVEVLRFEEEPSDTLTVLGVQS